MLSMAIKSYSKPVKKEAMSQNLPHHSRAKRTIDGKNEWKRFVTGNFLYTIFIRIIEFWPRLGVFSIYRRFEPLILKFDLELLF